MHRGSAIIFRRFDLDDKPILDDHIEPISAIQSHTFINDRQRNLPLDLNTGFGELETEALLVSGLKKPGPERTVNLNPEADNLFRQAITVDHGVHKNSATSAPLW